MAVRPFRYRVDLSRRLQGRKAPIRKSTHVTSHTRFQAREEAKTRYPGFDVIKVTKVG